MSAAAERIQAPAVVLVPVTDELINALLHGAGWLGVSKARDAHDQKLELEALALQLRLARRNGSRT